MKSPSGARSTDSRLWPILGVTTALCTLLMLYGFYSALRDTWFPSSGIALPEGSNPPAAASSGSLSDKPEILVTALGDSLTKGTGDDTGEGYVRRTVSLLKQAYGKPVTLVNNLAVNGLTAVRLSEQLEQKGAKEAVARADVLLFTIGGNDLFQIAQSGGSIVQGGDVSPELLSKLLPQTEPLLGDVLAKLRTINPNARIVYVGLYNPFYDMPEAREMSASVLAWNDYAHALASADGNATVVPTYDLFESNVGRYLSSDHFHPNADGYERIAQRIVQALT